MTRSPWSRVRALCQSGCCCWGRSPASPACSAGLLHQKVKSHGAQMLWTNMHTLAGRMCSYIWSQDARMCMHNQCSLLGVSELLLHHAHLLPST